MMLVLFASHLILCMIKSTLLYVCLNSYQELAFQINLFGYKNGILKNCWQITYL